nr:hypothetical protein [Tanacetum cinerariifolium]
MHPVAPPSPDYVPGPEHPPSPDYVPDLEHAPLPIEIPYVPEPEYPEHAAALSPSLPVPSPPLPLPSPLTTSPTDTVAPLGYREDQYTDLLKPIPEPQLVP